jgi:hypothetical protein
MKTHMTAAFAVLTLITGCSTRADYFEQADSTLRKVTEHAIQIQDETDATWDEAAERAILTLPGGGREFALSDGVITYQTDEVCIGAWIVNLIDVVTAPCLDIDWGTDRLWPGGRSDCFIQT